jgi:hypothetical protein
MDRTSGINWETRNACRILVAEPVGKLRRRLDGTMGRKEVFVKVKNSMELTRDNVLWQNLVLGIIFA